MKRIQRYAIRDRCGKTSLVDWDSTSLIPNFLEFVIRDCPNRYPQTHTNTYTHTKRERERERERERKKERERERSEVQIESAEFEKNIRPTCLVSIWVCCSLHQNGSLVGDAGHAFSTEESSAQIRIDRRESGSFRFSISSRSYHLQVRVCQQRDTFLATSRAIG